MTLGITRESKSVIAPAGEQSEENPDTVIFAERFEDGEIGPWAPVPMPERANDRNGNNWYVVDTNPVAGEYTGRLDTAGQWDDNCLVTDEFVMDMTTDFELSFKWRTPDVNNCGPLVTQINKEGVNFEDDEPGSPRLADGIRLRLGPDAVNEQGSPFENKGTFSGTKFEQPSLALETTHTTTITKRGSTATLSIDGEQYATTDVTTQGQARLLIASEGTWGDPTTIFYDDIVLKQLSSDDATTDDGGTSDETTATGLIEDFEDGEITSNPSWEVVSGTPQVQSQVAFNGNYALFADGTGKSQDEADLQLDQPVTAGDSLSLWVYIDETTGNHPMIKLYSSQADGKFQLEFAQDDILRLNGDNTSWFDWGNFSPQTWYRVVFQKTSTETENIVVEDSDGNEVASSGAGSYSSLTDFDILHIEPYGGSSNYGSIYVDDVRFTPSDSDSADGRESTNSTVWTDSFADGSVDDWDDPANTGGWTATTEEANSGEFGAYLDYESSQKTVVAKRIFDPVELTSTTSFFFRTKVTPLNNAWILAFVDRSGNDLAKLKDENPAGKVYDYSLNEWVPGQKYQIGHDGDSPAWNGIRIDFDPDSGTVHVYEEDPAFDPGLNEEVSYNPNAAEEIARIEFRNKGTSASTGHHAAGYFDDFELKR
jgi:hypothetical protein